MQYGIKLHDGAKERTEKTPAQHNSPEDIRKIIAFIIPEKHNSLESLLADIKNKHKIYSKQMKKARNKEDPYLAQAV